MGTVPKCAMAQCASLAQLSHFDVAVQTLQTSKLRFRRISRAGIGFAILPLSPAMATGQRESETEGFTLRTIVT